MTNPLDVVIIIVNHNHGVLAQRTVESLYALTDSITFELIIVDNASTDGFTEWLSGNYSQVKVIRNSHPQGFAYNNNIAIRLALESPYILLLNPDIECMPGMLDTLIQFMKTHPNAGIVGPKLLNPDGTIQPSARCFSTPLHLLVRGLHLDSVFKNTKIMHSYLGTYICAENATDVDWITGAAMMVRRSAIINVGFMDDAYFLYAEDQDWCCRMWRAGWSVHYVPEAQAIHEHLREGMRKPWSTAARHQLVSAFKMFNKFNWHLNRE